MPLDQTSSGLDDLGAPSLGSWAREALATPRRHGHVEVEGIVIRWMAWGDPTAPGMLLFHGYLAHARVFAVVAPLLAADRHVVAFDLSGMGDSGWRASYDESTRAREAWSVAADAGLLDADRPPVLVSHSYGSAIAMRVVEDRPGEVGGLCLTDMMMLPPDVLRSYMVDRPQLDTAPPRRVRPTLEAILERFRLQPDQPLVDPAMVAFVARHAVTEVEGGWTWKFDPRVLVDDMRDPEWWADQPPRFAALDVPRAILHGDLSAILPPDAVAYVRGLAPADVPIVGIPRAHHHLMLDQPVAYVAAVRSLIALW